MKTNIKIQMNEVYGGDGVVRLEKMEKVSLSRKKKKTTTRDDLGVSTDRGTTEKNIEVVDEKINTFREIKGKPVLRLGGSHGKLWGAMRATGKQLADLGEFESKAFIDRIMNMVQINPVYVEVADKNWRKDDWRVDSIFQKMGGGFGAAIPLYFDVIEKSTVDMTLTYPDQIKAHIKKIIYGLENGSHMNKMRATIKILSFEPAKT